MFCNNGYLTSLTCAEGSSYVSSVLGRWIIKIRVYGCAGVTQDW